MTGPTRSGHNFTLDQLLLLDTIARRGTFAAAARDHHRVPSAISHAMKALEDTLGVQLFDRAGHKVALTPAGERVAELARRVLDHADALGAAAAQLRDGWEPEIRIVVDGALPMEPITAALRALAAAAAPTRIRVDVECQDGVRDRFDDDHADIMLTLELDRGRSGLELIPMPPLVMVLVASPDHPLGRAAGLRRPDLRAHTELVVRDTSPRLARTPRPAFLGTPSVIYLSDFHSKRLALIAAAGFGWIPEHFIRDDLAAGRLAKVDLLEGNAWTYEPHLATRTAQPPGRAGTLLIEALRAAW